MGHHNIYHFTLSLDDLPTSRKLKLHHKSKSTLLDYIQLPAHASPLSTHNLLLILTDRMFCIYNYDMKQELSARSHEFVLTAPALSRLIVPRCQSDFKYTPVMMFMLYDQGTDSYEIASYTLHSGGGGGTESGTVRKECTDIK